mgnify:CR=1 FL=1
MEVLLFRHGPAEPATVDRPDAERALTPRGHERTLLAAQGLARVVDRPAALLSSPKKRAHQTACLLGEVFDLPVTPCPELADEDLPALQRALRDLTEDAVALVGHEPTLGRLAAHLLGIPARTGAIEVKKAAAVLLDAPFNDHDLPGPATLQMLLPPRVLRHVGETTA